MFDSVLYVPLVPNMPGLRRILNMSELFLNMSKSAWMSFALHVFIVIPGLLEHMVTVLILTKFTQEQWTFFLEEAKFDFFCGS